MLMAPPGWMTLVPICGTLRAWVGVFHELPLVPPQLLHRLLRLLSTSLVTLPSTAVMTSQWRPTKWRPRGEHRLSRQAVTGMRCTMVVLWHLARCMKWQPLMVLLGQPRV